MQTSAKKKDYELLYGHLAILTLVTAAVSSSLALRQFKPLN